ncbi:MAG: MATE family efflux transporter [Tenuifilum sp.]|uniref:MATE family efflux transporter n=1 Tax=Tenuifilum sp. TaxID=2760880 RepID=UPI001B77AF7B|nr:MATE family efflux transporter [Bacteroidales bacterium]HON69713.1 MATE family efflux transporter [Tenuifilum sp.]MBP9028852.1 MATE family efflux transporter [Bacteroidales bacterium]HOU73143.1 MATE family efflux transporter [Tenuifilum sp.]HQE53511.1 MATE family efflux transporter [Tenuifilum sp.]
MKDFTTGNEAKHIFRFALPMLIGNIFQQLYNVVDSIIVGRYLGDKALAAVGASFPIIFMVIALIIGIGIGSSVVISQYFGAKDFDRVKRAADTTYIFLFFAGIIITIVGLLSGEYIFRLMRLPEEILPMAKTYLDIYMYGLVLMFGFNSVSSILRGVGDSKTPLYFLIVSTFLNIFLDTLFVLGFKWGIAGAAWATVIAQAFSFIIAVIYLERLRHMLRITFKRLVFDWEIFWQSVRIGLPTGIQQTLVALGGMALMGIVNTFGTEVIAGFSAASRIDSLAVIPIMNFSASLSGFVGQNIGAGKVDRVKRGLWATIKMSVLFSVIITAIILIWGDKMMVVFTTNPRVVDIGYHYLMVVSFFYVAFAVMFCINGLLRGAGAAVVPMYITLLSLWIVRIPLAYLLSKTFGMNEAGVWWSIPIGWLMGAVASTIYYRYGSWKNKSVVKPVTTEDDGVATDLV